MKGYSELYRKVYFDFLATLPKEQQRRILAEKDQNRMPPPEVVKFCQIVERKVSDKIKSL